MLLLCSHDASVDAAEPLGVKFAIIMTKLKLEELILLLQAERVRRKIPFETIAKRGGWPNESNVRRLEKPDANPTLRTRPDGRTFREAGVHPR